METTDYWIYEDKIIFKPNFNDKLDNYFDIISKYNELIFSNYDDYNIIFKTNNKYCNEYEQNFKYSIFNKQIIIPQNITHLIFGCKFNQQVTIPHIVTHLTFDCEFNQQVTIPENVIHLTFGYYFNQQVIIPHNVTHLTLGNKFNKQVNLPNIKYIKLDCNNINLIEKLPNSIEEIEFGRCFNLELQNLPNSIKKISFDCYSKYDKELNCLPESVEYLKLNIGYDKRIKKFPLNLKTIECHKIYKYIDDFKDKYNVIIHSFSLAIFV